MTTLKEIMNETRPQPIQLTLEDCMAHLRIGMTKLKELINSKELPSYMIGGIRYVHSTDAARFVAKFRNDQNPDIERRL